MATKSSEVTATFLHYLTTLLLLQILLFSFVRGDEAVCGNFCPPVGFVDGWETRCHLQQSLASCGDSVVSDVPFAPSNLIVRNFIHEFQGTRLLALNITWTLPVTGNFTGLEGFYVNVVKSSPPVGFSECNGIRFDHPLAVSSFASEIVFHYSCLPNIGVDSLYYIEITSIGSQKRVILPNYHTPSCAEALGVGGCDLGFVSPDEWKPSQLPAAIVQENIVIVDFSLYPWDNWLTYKINLRPCNGQPTPRALSKIDNPEGATGRYSVTFDSVPPGCYSARVSLYMKDSTIIDGYEFRSESFNVSRVLVKPAVGTSPQKPEGLTTPADVTENDIQGTKPVSKTLLVKGLIGAGVGIAVAVLLLLATFVVKQRRKATQSEIVSPQETPRDGLVGNMVQNDLTGPGCCDAPGYGDSVSVFRPEGPSQCCECDHAGFPGNPEDFTSVTNMSGVTV